MVCDRLFLFPAKIVANLQLRLVSTHLLGFLGTLRSYEPPTGRLLLVSMDSCDRVSL